MGQLKPGATYIYERSGGITYAREAGADPSTRFAIGWDYEAPTHDIETFRATKEARLWKKIRETAKTNKPLQRMLERVILVYNIIRKSK
jgi:hypothetical protein